MKFAIVLASVAMLSAASEIESQSHDLYSDIEFGSSETPAHFKKHHYFQSESSESPAHFKKHHYFQKESEASSHLKKHHYFQGRSHSRFFDEEWKWSS